MAAVAITNLGASLSNDVATLSAWRMVLAAVSAAFAGLTMSSVIQFVAKERKGRALGYLAAGFAAALVLGVPVSILITDVGGWPIAMGIVTVSGAIVSCALWFSWPGVDTAQPVYAPFKASMVRLLPTSHFIAQGCMFLWMLSYAIPFTFLPTMLREIFSYSSVELTGLMILFGVSCVAGAQLGGMVSDRIGELSTITLAFSIHAVILFDAPLLMVTLSGLILTMVILGCASSMSTPPLQAQIAKTSGDISDLMLTLSNSALHVGIAVGAWVGSVLMLRDTEGLFYTPAAVLFMAVLALRAYSCFSRAEVRS